VICLNGAAARLAHVGDLVIILTYAVMEREELLKHTPKVVMVDERNRIRKPQAAESGGGAR
jgi:aspartate 1-decarboxylase